MSILLLREFEGKLYYRSDSTWYCDGKVISNLPNIYVKNEVLYEYDATHLYFNKIVITKCVRSIFVDNKIYIGDNGGYIHIYKLTGEYVGATKLTVHSNDITCITRIDGTLYASQSNYILRIGSKYECEQKMYITGNIVWFNKDYIIDTADRVYRINKWQQVTYKCFDYKCLFMEDRIILVYDNYISIYDNELNLKYDKNLNLYLPCVCNGKIYHIKNDKIEEVNIEPPKNLICPKCHTVPMAPMTVCECGETLEDLELWISKTEDIKPCKQKMLHVSLLCIDNGDITLKTGESLNKYIVDKQNDIIEKERSKIKNELSKLIDDKYPKKSFVNKS